MQRVTGSHSEDLITALDKLEETWTDQRTREWSEAKVALDKVGITIEGDFF